MTVGVVLAGGTGRRMGGDKALVALHGRPLLQYPVDALREVTDRVAVVCKQDTKLPLLPPDVEIWCEEDPRHHPLVGVTAALQRASGADVLVCAGDMPHVTPEVLRALLDAPAGLAAVARAAGRLQPLLARYAPAALPVFEAMDPDEPATRVVERLDPVLVDVAERAVLNVNAPEDLLR